MRAVLYNPNQPAHQVATVGLVLPSPTGQATVTEEVANHLGCVKGLVDVLDCGPDYVAYSVFDCESAVNKSAMVALEMISGHHYDLEDEDQVLRGPILVVTR